MQNSAALMILISSLLFGFCSSDGDDEADTTEAAEEIKGIWARCAASGADSKSLKIFGSTTVIQRTKNYLSTNATCTGTTTSSSIDVQGTFTIGGSVVDVNGDSVSEIDTLVTRVTTGAGVTTDGGISINETLYDIYKIEGNQIYFGKDNNSCGSPCKTKAKRPSELDKTKPHTKQ